MRTWMTAYFCNTFYAQDVGNTLDVSTTPTNVSCRVRHLYFMSVWQNWQLINMHLHCVHHVTMKNYFSFVADLKQLRVVQEANNHFEILFLWPWGEGTRVLQGHIGHINDLIKKQLEQPQLTSAFQITINNPVSLNLLRLKHSVTQLLRDVPVFITAAVCLTQLGT